MQNTTFHKHVHTPTAITLNNVTIHPSPCGINHSYFNIKLKDVATAVNATIHIAASRFSHTMHQLASPSQGTEPLYYFHGDHLGSASWITDKNGIPVQHLQYLPFGEPYVNQHVAGCYEERFTFTAKASREGNRTPMNKIKCSEERDPETGFSYFGARYYDPDLSALWLSVDPMADKYPGISPYAYYAWNPVRLVDPEGMMFDSISIGIVRKFEENTKALIDIIEKKTNKSDNDITKLAEYTSALDELKALKNDKHTLYIIEDNAIIDDPTTQGYTTYGGKIGDIDVITIKIGSNLSTLKGSTQLAHELKHAYQFYSGNLIFAVDFESGSVISNNSMPLEIEAYSRHKAYAPIILNAEYFGGLPESRITATYLKNKYPNHTIISR